MKCERHYRSKSIYRKAWPFLRAFHPFASPRICMYICICCTHPNYASPPPAATADQTTPSLIDERVVVFGAVHALRPVETADDVHFPVERSPVGVAPIHVHRMDQRPLILRRRVSSREGYEIKLRTIAKMEPSSYIYVHAIRRAHRTGLKVLNKRTDIADRRTERLTFAR